MLPPEMQHTSSKQGASIFPSNCVILDMFGSLLT
jgi:hypothetical protein